MEIIISEGSDPRVWPFAMALVLLFSASVAGLWMAFDDRDTAKLYGRSVSDGGPAIAAAAKRRAKWLFRVSIPLLLLSVAALGVSYKVGTAENYAQHDAITATLYENFDVANIKISDGNSSQIPNKLVCAEGAPPAKDRPYSEASWINDDGSYSEGVFVNMGNVDGECRFILAPHPGPENELAR